MPEVVLLKKKSYLAMVRNAARGENHMFRSVYALVDNKEQDILDDGALACAFFLSSVLYINKLTTDMHTNMLGLERDLAQSGWRQVPEPREGALLIWEARRSQKERSFQPTRLHAGIYIGKQRAISNGSSSTLMPEEHHYTYDDTRKIIRVWWHPSLE